MKPSLFFIGIAMFSCVLTVFVLYPTDIVQGQTLRSFNVMDDKIVSSSNQSDKIYKFQTDPLAKDIKAVGSYKVENADEIFINIYEDPEDTTGTYLPCPVTLEDFTDYSYCIPVYTQQATAGGIDASLSPGKTYYLIFGIPEGENIQITAKLDIQYYID